MLHYFLTGVRKRQFFINLSRNFHSAFLLFYSNFRVPDPTVLSYGIWPQYYPRNGGLLKNGFTVSYVRAAGTRCPDYSPCFVYTFFRNVYFFFMGSDPTVRLSLLIIPNTLSNIWLNGIATVPNGEAKNSVPNGYKLTLNLPHCLLTPL